MKDEGPSTPSVIAGYRLLRRVGEGGSGTVFEAVDATGGRVAVKLLHKELAESEAVRALLQAEAATLQRVRSERTAQFLDIGVDDDTPYLVMEFVPGKNLEESVAEQVLTGPLLRALAEGLVDALAAIHAAGVVHRDLKPQNVIFGPGGVKVVDFGTSILAEAAGSTRTGALVGTPAWLAPEQAVGSDVGPAADVFNLGMLIAYAGGGKHPFGQGRADAMLFRIVHEEPDLSTVPSSLLPLVQSCLAKTPAERPTLDEIAHALRRGGSGSGPSRGGVNETRLATETRIQAAVSSESRGRQPMGEIRLRRRTVYTLSGASLLLGAAMLAVLFLARAEATGGITFRVDQQTTSRNPWLSVGTVEVQVGQTVRSFQVDGEGTTGFVRLEGLDWDTATPMQLEYRPGFSNDEGHSIALDLRQSGARFASRGRTVRISVSADDDAVTLSIEAPVTTYLVRPERQEVHNVRLSRSNESEFRATVARELAAAQRAARAEQAACVQDGLREARFFLDPIFGFSRRYEAALDRLWRLGRLYDSASWDVWAQRSRNVSSFVGGEARDVEQFVRLRPRVSPETYGAMLDVPGAITDLQEAWGAMSRAMGRESTSGFRAADEQINLKRTELASRVRQVEFSLNRELSAICADAYPVP